MNSNLSTKQKEEFLKTILSGKKITSQNELTSVLLQVFSKAGQANIQFTDEEAEQLADSLSANLSPEEQKKVRMLRSLASLLSKQQNQKGKPESSRG